eukprot:TRINITY_DN65339_c0_g1_i1.p1 TRINITY_DN65339_c0_g1~~TRINITY_DN65339_c0_g1_i1.p1  ORF type:complete len:376 (-),score=67.19 TRINITY_DN65339_c0_g1_i1:87-1214(-)
MACAGLHVPRRRCCSRGVWAFTAMAGAAALFWQCLQTVLFLEVYLDGRQRPSWSRPAGQRVRVRLQYARRQGAATELCLAEAAQDPSGAAERSLCLQRMSDTRILENLAARRGWICKDMGSGGNCLFRSIAQQISTDDLDVLAKRRPQWMASLAAAADRGLPLPLRREWPEMTVLQRGRVLRKIAILDEREFLGELEEVRRRRSPLPPRIVQRILELFKDMAEEFISRGKTELAKDELEVACKDEALRDKTLSASAHRRNAIYQRVSSLAQESSENTMIDFVLKHAEEYLAITGRDGNWAGSSEMEALAHAFSRRFESYGNNWVSGEMVELEEVGTDLWEVRPYFQSCSQAEGADGRDAVRVFQTRGGGHYRMLI